MVFISDPLDPFSISRFTESCVFREKIIRVDIQNRSKFYCVFIENRIESFFQINNIPDIIMSKDLAELLLADLLNLAIIPQLFARTGMYRWFQNRNNKLR